MCCFEFHGIKKIIIKKETSRQNKSAVKYAAMEKCHGLMFGWIGFPDPKIKSLKIFSHQEGRQLLNSVKGTNIEDSYFHKILVDHSIILRKLKLP